MKDTETELKEFIEHNAEWLKESFLKSYHAEYDAYILHQFAEWERGN